MARLRSSEWAPACAALLVGCVWAAALAGCHLSGLVGARIEVQTTQESLEQQVLGAFQDLGQEVYALAGVRSIDPVTGAPTAPPPMTGSERAALDARRRMEFNLDDVQQFLAQGYVGEGNQGLLVAFDEAMNGLQRDDPRRYRLVSGVVAEENEDRLTVMRRIVQTNPDLSGADGLATVGRVLAARNRQSVPAGSRIQLPDGTWVTKQEAAQ